MKSLLPAILLPFLVLTSRSQTPEPETGLTDDETAKVLAEITKVQREFAKTKNDLLANALARFKAASASDATAGEFFLAAYRVVNLDRKPATTKEEQEERADGEWQKKALASLGEGASSTVLRMQLHLLVMMLEASSTEDPAIVERLRTYMQGVISFMASANAAPDQPPVRRPGAADGRKGKKEDEPRGREPEGRRPRTGTGKNLHQNVMGTLFAEAYNLGTYFQPPSQWPASPADFRAAYLNVILPWYRTSKKTDLPVVWDEFLKGETTMQQMNLGPDGLEAWSKREYKQLYWSKWLDLLSNGVNATAAVNELVTTVRENPSHPALKTWIADLARVAESLGGLKFDDTTPPPVSQ